LMFCYIHRTGELTNRLSSDTQVIQSAITVSLLLHNSNVLSGNVLSGNVLTGNVLSGNVLAGNVLSGNVLTGNVLSGNVLTGNVLTGNVLTGNVLTGNVLSGNVLLGNVLSGNIRSGSLYSQVMYCRLVFTYPMLRLKKYTTENPKSMLIVVTFIFLSLLRADYWLPGGHVGTESCLDWHSVVCSSSYISQCSAVWSVLVIIHPMSFLFLIDQL